MWAGEDLILTGSVHLLDVFNVGGRGLEPPHLTVSVPKTDVSTNFTTRPLPLLY